ncbi:MAG: GNAT family N-acetyltransferase [Nakamurella sp.]
MPTLRGENVVLRKFSAADLAMVREAAGDPFIPLITSVPAHGNDVECLAFLARQHERSESGAGYSFAVEDQHTGQAVGQIGLWLKGLEDGRASVGYWIVASHRQRGIARRALSLVTRWGIEHRGIARLELYVEPWNTASWRTAESVGYQREGLLRAWQQVGGQRRDMYMYSRLASGR